MQRNDLAFQESCYRKNHRIIRDINLSNWPVEWNWKRQTTLDDPVDESS